jgi:xanthine/uracil permease
MIYETFFIFSLISIVFLLITYWKKDFMSSFVTASLFLFIGISLALTGLEIPTGETQTSTNNISYEYIINSSQISHITENTILSSTITHEKQNNILVSLLTFIFIGLSIYYYYLFSVFLRQ